MPTRLYTYGVITCLLTLSMSGAQSQTRDSLALIREFVQGVSTYQQLPLQLEMELNNSTNFITSEADTTKTAGYFYIKPGSAYILFGEMEQVVNDSMALLISNNLQRMILYPDAKAILAQMKSMTAIPLQDSSVLHLAGKFTIQKNVSGVDQYKLLLTGRQMVYNTQLPKESIELQYDQKNQRPLKVTTIKRTLLPLSEEDYKTFSGRADLSGKLLNLEDKGYFLVKEQVADFVYKKLTHDTSLKVPVTIADKIEKNSDGAFSPVKKYGEYSLTVN